MNRHFWIGLTILLLLLALSVGSLVCIGHGVAGIERQLLLAWQEAAAGNVTAAHGHAQKAESDWDRLHHLAACFTSHEELEDIEQGFHELRSWNATGSAPEYAASCIRLAYSVRALAEDEIPYYYNFL